MPELYDTVRLAPTDTVATQTLEDHQLSRRKGGQLFMPSWSCSCGRVGDEAWGPLHLVEMGVEAGVAAMAQLREATTVLSAQERAERDLAGYMGGMLGTGRAIGPDWRDQLSLLVDWASQVSSVPSSAALSAGGRLWLELERLEGIDSIREDGADPEPYTATDAANAYRHSSSAQGDPTTVEVATCDQGALHDGHTWRAPGGRAYWCTGS